MNRLYVSSLTELVIILFKEDSLMNTPFTLSATALNVPKISCTYFSRCINSVYTNIKGIPKISKC
jgi:hypothetical protein